MFTWKSSIDFQRPELPIFLLQSLNLKSSVFKILNNYSVTLSVSNVTLCSFGKNVLLQMVVRKTKEDRSVRETQPVVLAVKQKESLSYMNSREFTDISMIIKLFNALIYDFVESVMPRLCITFDLCQKM